MSMPSGCSAVSAAPMSDPSSIVPVVSMVTCEMIGNRRPAAAMPSWHPRTAALTCSRSWLVSIRYASAPPRASPSAALEYAFRMSSKVV